MKIDLQGKVAIVTGGAMGIGAATAQALASCGASVAILDSNAEAGADLAARISHEGHEASSHACRVDLAVDVSRAVEEVVETYGRLDILVNNAGIQLYGDVVTMPESEWDRLININLKGPFLVSKYAVPHILVQGGSIVIVGSVQSMSAVSNSVAYVSSKHALLGLTRAMALDYAQKGIRVNCVCPGSVDTPMLRWASGLSADPSAVIETCNRMHPLGRIARAEEVANTIAYLVSPLASFITGAAIMVDGGMLVPAGGMGFQEIGSNSPTK